jgi:hypothetical protein
VIEVDGVTVPRALVTELAHRLVFAGELETADALIAGLAGGRPSIALTDRERQVVRAELETTPIQGLETLRSSLAGQAPPDIGGPRGLEPAGQT